MSVATAAVPAAGSALVPAAGSALVPAAGSALVPDAGAPPVFSGERGWTATSVREKWLP
ncbi:hypothetical protein GA0115245_12448 [Streptomyces sp. di188]|nr:hypothetical protein GA0115238_13648 [Streptomyces sp. di50b]SCE16768.1 hypothetical protein GA0115245_12448 [Streptomyces sp. di188]